jgi:hypothetical protein
MDRSRCTLEGLKFPIVPQRYGSEIADIAKPCAQPVPSAADNEKRVDLQARWNIKVKCIPETGSNKNNRLRQIVNAVTTRSGRITVGQCLLELLDDNEHWLDRNGCSFIGRRSDFSESLQVEKIGHPAESNCFDLDWGRFSLSCMAGHHGFSGGSINANDLVSIQKW